MPTPARVLILGGGFAGMFAARALAKSRGLARSGTEARITLVDEHNYFVFQPLLPEVAAGTLDAADAVTPFRLLLKGVRVIEGEVVGVDLTRRRVEVVQGMRRRIHVIGYDHLVVALGSRVDLSRYPGLSEHALTMKDLADAFVLRNHLIDCLEQADGLDPAIAEEADLRRRLLTFVVIGGGLSGIETAGEIEDLVSRAMPYYPRLRRDEIRIVVAEFRDRILPELAPNLAAYAGRALGRRGIEVVVGAGVASASRESVELTDGRVLRSLTVIATIGNAPRPLVADLPLAKERGRLVADPHLRVTGQDNVWAIGDCATITDAEGNLVPPTAQAAVQEAATLARNLAGVLEGRAPAEEFRYRSRGQLASLGGRRGVAEVMGVQVIGFPAWLLWRSVYLGLLPGFAAKVRVVLDWALDSLFPRNLVQIAQRPARAVNRLRFRPGEVVYHRGDHAGAVFIVESGTFVVEEEGVRLGPGEAFGTAALDEGRTRRATVRAEDQATCLAVRRGDFEDVAACLGGISDLAERRRRRETEGIGRF